MGSQMSWLELECVGDLETSQGSISTASLDSGYHPHWNLKQKGGRYLVSSTSGIANSWFSVLLSMYEDASGAQVPASSFSTSTCGDMLFWFFFSGGKGQPIRVISLHCLVSELVGKVTLFQTITGEKNQNNLIPSFFVKGWFDEVLG